MDSVPVQAQTGPAMKYAATKQFLCGAVLALAVNVTEICDTGDDLEIDFRNGFFINHTRDIRREYPPVPDSLLEIVELGGNTGCPRAESATPASITAATATSTGPCSDHHPRPPAAAP